MRPSQPWLPTFALLALVLVSHTAAGQEKARYDRRWFYAAYNLQVDQNAEKLIELIGRASRSGYNGVVLADYKFNVLDRVIPRYFDNLARVKKAADEAGIEVIPTVCPIGYSSGLLAHDVNLAEGLPVKDAPAVVTGGVAAPVAAAELLANGGLEQARGDRFAGLSFQDGIGICSFADAEVKHGGKLSCRIEDAAKSEAGGNCRLAQRVKVRPYACYRLSCWLKTHDLKPTGSFRLLALGGGAEPRTLSYFDDEVQSTQDWKRVEVVFNSLHHDTVTIYAGVWGGPAGTLWVDDWQLEELFLVNVLRRPGCPLRLTSEDGSTAYEEGKDFEAVRDPKLGQTPYAGEYSFRHTGPGLRLTAGSRIRDGQKLKVSWYHPVLTHSYQVMCCLTEPKIYDLLRDQVKKVNDLLKPKTFFMAHDEIRVANWCAACQQTGRTPGQLLAGNVRRCVQMIRDVSPRADIVVWSDMFDPHHNAVENYYLVNGPWTGSWEGLPKDVIIANWNGGKAEKSLRWFAGRGYRQVIAGYYDGGIDNFHRWDAPAAGVPGVTGFLYTTWQDRYTHLEEYGKAMSRR